MPLPFPPLVPEVPPEQDPTPPALVHPDDLARRLGLDLPLTGDVSWALREAIAAVQSDVEVYLGRPLVAEKHVTTSVPPGTPYTALPGQPVHAILSTVPDGHGGYTVTYIAGPDLSAAGLTAVRRYVLARAALDPDVTRLVPSGKREITSVSVEGQSVSFKPVGGVSIENLPPEQQVPQLTSLERYKRRGVFQRRTPGVR